MNNMQLVHQLFMVEWLHLLKSWGVWEGDMLYCTIWYSHPPSELNITLLYNRWASIKHCMPPPQSDVSNIFYSMWPWTFTFWSQNSSLCQMHQWRMFGENPSNTIQDLGISGIVFGMHTRTHGLMDLWPGQKHYVGQRHNNTTGQLTYL